MLPRRHAMPAVATVLTRSAFASSTPRFSARFPVSSASPVHRPLHPFPLASPRLAARSPQPFVAFLIRLLDPQASAAASTPAVESRGLMPCRRPERLSMPRSPGQLGGSAPSEPGAQVELGNPPAARDPKDAIPAPAPATRRQSASCIMHERIGPAS